MTARLEAPPRPRLGRELARRLDRLAFRAHAFHRWAHHPLCHEYEGEVFRLGRRFRLCRGCTLAALGGLGGLVAGLALPALGVRGLALGAAMGGLAAIPALGRRRWPKVLTRALPSGLLLYLALQALRSGGPVPWFLAACAGSVAMVIILAYRRRGPDRTPCTTCPEFSALGTCRGFREIRTRERAFTRLASRWLHPTVPGR